MGKNLRFHESPVLQKSEAELFNTPDPVISPTTRFASTTLTIKSEEQLAFYRLNYSKWMICQLEKSELTLEINKEISRWHKRYIT